jgi:hypothetical protein
MEEIVSPTKRPKEVTLAAIILFVAFSFGLVRQSIWLNHHSVLTLQPQLRFEAFIINVISSSLVMLLLVLLLLMVHRGRNWARQVSVGVIVLRVLTSVPQIYLATKIEPLAAAVSATRTVLELSAIYLLFTAASAAWFKRNKS